MQITDITLTNFRRHRSLQVGLQPGVIGIIGRNGAGKSSFLEGLYYGITGGSIGDDNKGALVTWGQRRGEVSMGITVGDKAGRLIRRVGGNVASLEIEGEARVNGIQPVNSRMAELLGTSLGHLRDILFVPQENLDSPLRGTDAARKEAFGRLFGCHRFETIRGVLQNALGNVVDGTEQSMAAQRKALEESVAAAEAGANEAAVALDTLELKERTATPTTELYRIANATPRSRIDQDQARVDAELAEVAKALEGYGPEETSTWDVEKLRSRLAHAKAVITLFETGVCPTCGLTGGATGETLEGATTVAEQAHNELLRKEEFERLVARFVELDNYSTRLKDTPCEDDDVIAGARALLEQKAEEDRIVREAHSRKGAADARLEAALTALESHARREEEAAQRLTTAATLVKVRECFHRDALQADVRAYGVGLINTWLTDMLSIFSIPYRVYFNSDGLLKFTAPPSEEEHDFLDLSGGQRKLVALAYRLALMRLFMGNLNLAVLDEPTPFIDEENVEMMCESFQSLRKVSAQKGMTVLVATHEKRLFAAFDRIIEL